MTRYMQRIKNAAHRILWTFFLPMTMLTLLSLPIHTYAFYIVAKKKSLAFSVKFLMALLAILRLASSILRSFFAMCYHKSNCWLGPPTIPGYWGFPTVTNLFVIPLYQISNRWMVFLELGLSVNRFLALFFDGMYYHNIQKLTFPLAISSFLMTTVPYAIVVHRKRMHLQLGFEHVLFNISAISIALDVLTYFRLKLSVRHKASNQKSSAELRLSIMAISTHIVQVLPTVLLQKDRFGGFRWALSHFVTIYNYHWHTVHAVSQLFMSLIVIFLVRQTADEKRAQYPQKSRVQ